jgi:glucuronoarabinoxylan endo-1,4-beta-xylanase
MNLKSIGTSPLLFLLAACSQASPTPPGDQGGSSGSGGTHAAGGSGGSVSAGGSGASAGTGGGNAAGGTTGGSSSGGTGGTVSGGAGGSVATGGAGGSLAAGTGGTGSATGGSGGLPSAGMGGTGMAAGGMGTGGAVAGSGGRSAGGAAGSAGAGMAGSGGSAGANTGATTVQLTQLHQKIEGFGINDTYASTTLPSSLFDATKDIGLTILRVGMNSMGALQNPNESTDMAMVKKISGTKIIGSCWSAPANYKTNGQENGGGHLKPEKYSDWATTITTFATSNGLYAMSAVNEPDFASCGSQDPCNGDYATMLYTANELVAFIKVAGPMLQAAGVKVITPEASEWNHLWSNTSAGPDVGGKNSSDPLKCGFPPSNAACDKGDGYDYGHYLAKDATAWAAFDIMGIHEYDSQQAYPWPSDVTAARKEVWQTEMSGVKWWPEQGPSSDIANGIAVAGWIHSALVVGDASAWLYWWYTTSGDNEGLLLGSTDTKRHYTLGNYSKFVRPGYNRVEITGTIPADVLPSAYVGPDGTVVIVVINKSKSAVSVPITIAGGTAPASMTPWVTSASDNLVSKTAVPVSNGAFTMALGASTVTTFVGK